MRRCCAHTNLLITIAKWHTQPSMQWASPWQARTRCGSAYHDRQNIGADCPGWLIRELSVLVRRPGERMLLGQCTAYILRSTACLRNAKRCSVAVLQTYERRCLVTCPVLPRTLCTSSERVKIPYRDKKATRTNAPKEARHRM